MISLAGKPTDFSVCKVVVETKCSPASQSGCRSQKLLRVRKRVRAELCIPQQVPRALRTKGRGASF